MVPDLTFRRYDGQMARAARDTVALIHGDAYVERIHSGDPFYTVDAFMQRFDAHTTAPSFELVMAYVGDEPVGQVWGWAIKEPTIAHSPEDATEDSKPAPDHKDGQRTFALAEIMVREAWTGQGIAHALHDELLGARLERRAELFVNPDNTRARRAYLKWGWHKVGQIRPDLPDAPLFDVLVLPLPISH
jgi:GNAT superfamily N-acetyltransferase